jgi:hypothetical protein
VVFDLLKCLFQITNMTHSDPGHTGGCCCHRIVMQFDEIKNELQNVRQAVSVAITLLSVSRKWFVVKASYLPLQNLDTQTHTVSRVQNSVEQMYLILMCCNIYKVYYETSVKSGGYVLAYWEWKVVFLAKRFPSVMSGGLSDAMYTHLPLGRYLIMLCHRNKTAVCSLFCVSFVNRSVHVMSSDEY